MHWVILLISGEGVQQHYLFFIIEKKFHSYHYHSVSLTYQFQNQTFLKQTSNCFLQHYSYIKITMLLRYAYTMKYSQLVIFSWFCLLLYAIESESRSGFSLVIYIYHYMSSIQLQLLYFVHNKNFNLEVWHWILIIKMFTGNRIA